MCDLSVDECSERQVVKQIGKVLPHVCVAVLAQTLIVEAINLSDLSALVVATKNGDAIFEPHLTQTCQRCFCKLVFIILHNTGLTSS